jgi:hypothetical protein
MRLTSVVQIHESRGRLRSHQLHPPRISMPIGSGDDRTSAIASTSASVVHFIDSITAVIDDQRIAKSEKSANTTHFQIHARVAGSVLDQLSITSTKFTVCVLASAEQTRANCTPGSLSQPMVINPLTARSSVEQQIAHKTHSMTLPNSRISSGVRRCFSNCELTFRYSLPRYLPPA